MPAKDENFVPLTFDDVYDADLDWEHRGKFRKIVIGNGNEIYLESVDPFGHWKVTAKKGRLPDWLKDGSWTTFRDALAAANKYLHERKLPIVYQTNQATKETVKSE